jgi:hypothetical protein
MKKQNAAITPAIIRKHKSAATLTRNESKNITGGWSCFPPDPRCIKAGRCQWLCP